MGNQNSNNSNGSNNTSGNTFLNLIRQQRRSRALISVDEIKQSIKLMNTWCQRQPSEDGTYTYFVCSSIDTEPVFWRNNVKVSCFKVNRENLTIVSYRTLTLSEFLNAYEIQNTANSLDPLNKMDSFTASAIILSETADNEGKCCICMDNKNDVLLPCLHSFCLPCVTNELEWRPQFSCPLCKTRIEKPIEDSWEVPDIPLQSEVADYVKDILKK